MKNYIMVNIVLPILFLIGLPIILVKLAITYFEVSEINLVFITLNLKNNSEIPCELNLLLILLIIATLTYIAFAIVRKINKDREFLGGNIYGTQYYAFYLLARVLGFKKISLKRKPYYVICKLIRKNLFEFIGLEKENEDLENTVQIVVEEKPFNNIPNLRECNLIISDTYEIDKTNLPQEKQIIDTIIIKRIGSNGIRISSHDLVNKVRESTIKIMKTGADINLYMTTSTYNTYKIITECFMQANRDKMKVLIFHQNTKDRKFNEKGKII